MSIYTRLSIDENDEIKSERGEGWKVVQPSGSSYKILYSFTSPIHFKSPIGFGKNRSVEELQDIDTTLRLEKTKSGWGWSKHWTTSSNIFKVGFRDDNKSSKFQTIRPYISDDYHIDITPYKAFYDSNVINLSTNFKSTAISGSHKIIHKPDLLGPMGDRVSIETYPTHLGVKSYFKIDYPLTELRYQEKIETTGYEITNSHTMSGAKRVYIPDKENRFTFKLSSNHIYYMSILHPKLATENTKNKSKHLSHAPKYTVDHRLIESKDGSFIYEKYTTPSGNDWLLTQTPPYLIDAQTTCNGITKDGYVEHQVSDENQQTSWDTCHDAATGTNVSDTDQNHTEATEAAQSQAGKNWISDITRSFYYFSTNTVTSDMTVFGVSGYIYAGKFIGAGTIGFQEGTQAATLTTADFDSFTGVEIADRQSLVGSQDPATLIFGFYKSGFSWFTKGGITKIAIRDATYDIDDTMPGALSAKGKLYYAEASVVEANPYLVVYYTEAEAAAAAECENPGEISMLSGVYGQELYVDTDSYGNEYRIKSTCS